MKKVIWEDSDGYKHLALVKDNDTENAGPSGLPCDPPDLHLLDWDQIVKEMHNGLVENGLSTWKDIQNSQTGITSTIISVLKRRIIMLYREREQGG